MDLIGRLSLPFSIKRHNVIIGVLSHREPGLPKTVLCPDGPVHLFQSRQGEILRFPAVRVCPEERLTIHHHDFFFRKIPACLVEFRPALVIGFEFQQSHLLRQEFRQILPGIRRKKRFSSPA